MSATRLRSPRLTSPEFKCWVGSKYATIKKRAWNQMGPACASTNVANWASQMAHIDRPTSLSIIHKLRMHSLYSCVCYYYIGYLFQLCYSLFAFYYLRSEYCAVDGAEIVPYKVTHYRRTKAFKSVVMVG